MHKKTQMCEKDLEKGIEVEFQLESRYSVANMKKILTNIFGASVISWLMLAVGVLVLNVLIASIFGFNYLFDTILKQVNRYR